MSTILSEVLAANAFLVFHHPNCGMQLVSDVKTGRLDLIAAASAAGTAR